MLFYFPHETRKMVFDLNWKYIQDKAWIFRKKKLLNFLTAEIGYKHEMQFLPMQMS